MELDLTQFDGHTPGPWLVVPASQPSPHKDYNVVAVDMRGVGANWRTKEGLPDALLHAAAPALLALAREQQQQIAKLRAYLDRILDAHDYQENVSSNEGMACVADAVAEARAALAETEARP